MDPNDRQRTIDLWMRVAGQTHAPLQVLGEFDLSQGQMAAFWEDLAQATQADDPEGIELILQAKIWSNIAKAPIAAPKFYLINILRRIDGWDQTQTKVVETFTFDGKPTGHSVSGGTRVLKRSAVEGAWLWRDALTLHPLCSAAFKECAEQIGCRGCPLEKSPSRTSEG